MKNRFRPIGRIFCWILTGMFVLALAAPVHAARTTRVVDTIYRADGLPASGTLIISWSAFTSGAGEAVAAGRMTVAIGAGGAVDIALIPNTGSTPASFYTVVIKEKTGVTSTEYWTVPANTSSTVTAVRSKVVPATVAAQFVGRDYVDSAIAASTKDNSGTVSLTPTGSQVVNQPAGSSLQINRANLADTNGIRFADRFGTVQATLNDAATVGAVVIPPGYSGTDLFSNSNSRPVLDLRRVGDFRGGRLSVLDFGADPTGGFYPAATMSSGSHTITINSSGNWATPGLKAGQIICMAGAGAGGADLCGHVVSYAGGSIVTDMTALSTASQRGAWWGRDNAAAFQAAVNACGSSSYSPYGGCEIDVPPGAYILSSTVTFPAINGVINGRVTLKCPAGRNGTKIIWSGADQGDMLRVPSNSVPVEVNGCTFESADFGSQALYGSGGGRRAGIAVNILGSTQHRMIDNYFGNLFEGLRLASTWLNLVDHNEFYGPYNAAIHAVNGVGPVNSNTVSNNEFGVYGLYGLHNEATGSGGSNGNLYFGNDFEGTTSITVADVDMNDNWGVWGSNRFETGGSGVSGYKSFISRGSTNEIHLTFCGGASILGTSNQVFCMNSSGPPLTDGGFNTFHGPLTRSVNGIATSSYIYGTSGNVVDTNGQIDLNVGVTGSAVPTANLMLDGKRFRSKIAAETNPNRPNCGSPETFSAGEVVVNKTAAVSGSNAYDQVFAWMCTNAAGCACPATAADWKEFGPLRSREEREGTAAPTTGAWVAGDKLWNTAPAGTNPVIGWVNTASGSPGTFAPIYAIDPANPPALGAITPAAGTFSTVVATNSVSAPAAQFTAQSTDLSSIAGGPVFWCKADAQVYADGASVTTCTDSAAPAHNAASSGTAPVFKVNATPTGKPVIRFAGAGYLQTAAFTLSQPETVCGVFSKAIGYSGGSLWDGRNGLAFNSASQYFLTATEADLYANGDGTTHIGGTAAVNDGKFHVVCSVINGASSTIYVDGVQVATGNAGSANMSGVTIGAASTGAVKVTADIGEVVVFGSALSVGNRQTVENYLMQKYISGFVSVRNAAGTITGQFDANGRLSASGAVTGFSTVTFSATPTFDAATGNTFKLTLTGNVTGSTLVNAAAGQVLSFIICQDATGSRTMVWPTNVKGVTTIGTTASKCSAQRFVFDGTAAYATGAGSTNQ